jgi:diguanylate cyclase (GGDEF)-like protein
MQQKESNCAHHEKIIRLYQIRKSWSDRAMDRLRKESIHDSLTGLYNRRYFFTQLQRESLLFRRHKRPLSLIMIDLDHFKRVNDQHGHIAGDHALTQLADLITLFLRETDVAARYGGEEIAILLPETSLEEAIEIAERLRIQVKETPVEWNDQTISITASFGVAQFRESSTNINDLLIAADAQLYAAKEYGRDCVFPQPEGQIFISEL